MGREIVKAKLDVVFKRLFTSDNEVLKAFIGDILDIPTGEIKKFRFLIQIYCLPPLTESNPSLI